MDTLINIERLSRFLTNLRSKQLKLRAGRNISLSTDHDTNTVTISSSGGGSEDYPGFAGETIIFSPDGKTITETFDDGNIKTTSFQNDGSIVETLKSESNEILVEQVVTFMSDGSIVITQTGLYPEFGSKTIVFSQDGKNITETDDAGQIKRTVFNSNGSITESIQNSDGIILALQTIVFNADGSITITREV